MKHDYRHMLEQDMVRLGLIRSLDSPVWATRYMFAGSNSTTDMQISVTESSGTGGITDTTEVVYRIAQEQELEVYDPEELPESVIKLLQNLERLNSFRLLQPGWNGYDADPLDDVVIGRARDLLLESKIFSFTPEIFPTARDSIQFEYRTEKGEYLEVEIYEDSFGIYMETEDKEREEDDLSRDEIVSIIRAFHAFEEVRSETLRTSSNAASELANLQTTAYAA